MKVIKGENLMLFVKEGDLFGNSSTALVFLGMATGCTMNLTVDPFDVTSKDSGSWKASIPGMKSWDMSTDNLYSEHFDKLMTLAMARTTIKLYWSPATNTESNNEVTHTPSLTVDGESYKYYVGDAWINNISANAPNDDAATYTCQFTGTGALTQSNSLPSQGVGVNEASKSMVQGGTSQFTVTGYTGTVTATPSNAKVTATVSNGVITVNVADDCPAGAYTIAVADSGTSTTTYIMVTVTAS